MGLRLTGRPATGAIMTATGGTGLPGKQPMIELRIMPVGGAHMTDITGQRGIHMLRCRGSACGNRSVMTRGARICRLVMRKRHNQRQPRGTQVASLAQIAGKRMLGILTGSRRPVMATKATAQHLGMIKLRGNPSEHRMTRVTAIRTEDMISELTDGRDPVMASHTRGVAHHTMIKQSRRIDRKTFRVMTSPTTDGDRKVSRR